MLRSYFADVEPVMTSTIDDGDQNYVGINIVSINCVNDDDAHDSDCDDAGFDGVGLISLTSRTPKKSTHAAAQ